jgi:hypothetical protein
MPIAGISQGLGIGGGTSATSSGGGGGGRAPFIPNAKSVLFDGTDDTMTLASELNFTGTFTFSIWVKPVSGNEGFISVGDSGTSGPWLDWYGAAYGNTWVLRKMGTITGAAGAATAGSWYHLLVIRDSLNVVKLYADGAQTGSSSSFTGTAEFSTFAAATAAGSIALNGYLDEIAFWDSDQTSNIAAIYNSRVAGDIWEVSPPLHWYRLGDINGGSGATIADIGSAADNDGTLNNGPTYTTDVPS